MTTRTAAAQIELTITTEDVDGDTYQVIEQSGQLSADITWTAEAMSDDHGRITIEAMICDEADLDDLIAKLEQLRGAARQVRAVCGF